MQTLKHQLSHRQNKQEESAKYFSKKIPVGGRFLIKKEKKEENTEKLLYQIYFPGAAATRPNCLNLRRQQKLGVRVGTKAAEEKK